MAEDLLVLHRTGDGKPKWATKAVPLVLSHAAQPGNAKDRRSGKPPRLAESARTYLDLARRSVPALALRHGRLVARAALDHGRKVVAGGLSDGREIISAGLRHVGSVADRRWRE